MNFHPDNVIGNIMGDKRKQEVNKSQPKHFIKDKETRKNVNFAVGGGLLGAFVGAPGIGVAVGLLAANKGKLEKVAKTVDNKLTGNKKW